MNESYAMCAYVCAIHIPPRIETTSAKIVKSGSISSSANRRGTTRKRAGCRAHRTQRLDLFGHDHRPELGGNRRADASRDDDPREHRAEFAPARRQPPADEAAEPVGDRLLRGFQRDHHPGEEPGEQSRSRATARPGYAHCETVSPTRIRRRAMKRNDSARAASTPPAYSKKSIVARPTWSRIFTIFLPGERLRSGEHDLRRFDPLRARRRVPR